MNNWIKQATQLENKIEQKLLSYSSLVGRIEQELYESPTVSSTINSSEDLFQKLTREIEDILKEFRSVNDKMKEYINDENNGGLISSTMVYQYEQHETVYNNCRKEFKTVRQRLTHKRDRHDLLSVASEEEESYDDSSDGTNTRYASDIQRLRDANMRTQQLITQSQHSKTALDEQMQIFKGFDKVLYSMRAQFPVLDGLMNRIQQKNRRDMLILSVLISVLIIITLLLTIAP